MARKLGMVLAAAVLLGGCGGDEREAAVDAPAIENPCAGTICANPHPPGWSGIDLAGGVSVHGNAIVRGETCGECHTQTGGGNSGQLDGVKNGDASAGLVCTHCHLSAAPGRTLFVAGRIHVDGWGAGWTPEDRARKVQGDTLAPLKGGVSAGCLACHTNG
jgi:hypothetical protein